MNSHLLVHRIRTFKHNHFIHSILTEKRDSDTMSIIKLDKNPLITPRDIKPSRPDFKVVCIFNCGVTRFNEEILLLMRVAEMPINDNPEKELVPILDLKQIKLS